MKLTSAISASLRALHLRAEPPLLRDARTLRHALRAVFGASALHSAEVLVPDRRQLVSELCRLRARSVQELWTQLAQQLGKMRFDQLPMLDLEALPLGLNLHELIEAGSLPIVSDGRLEGLVSCAPQLLYEYSFQQPLLAATPLIALASWEELEQCYRHSLNLHTQELQQRAQGRRLALDTLARQVLGHLIDKAEQSASQRAEVLIGSSQVSFSFMLGDGRSAMARIDARVATALASLLEQGKFVVPGPKGGMSSVRCHCESAGVRYALEWSRQQDLLAAPLVAASSPNGTILVVEDNPGFADVVVSFITRAGYKALQVTSLEDARQALGQQQFMGCVLDFELPDGQADELLLELRQRKDAAPLPTVVFTSHSESEIGIKAVRAGAVAVLKKSEDPRLLLAYLERWSTAPSATVLAA